MPENTVNLSERENEMVQEYARQNGITESQAIEFLYRQNLNERLRFRRKGGEVRTFRLPKRD